MIDDRFAPATILDAKPGGETLHTVLAELEREMEAAVRETIRARFAAVAAKINALGYKLVEQPLEQEASMPAFQVEWQDALDDEDFRIWLHVQVGAMRGYSTADELRDSLAPPPQHSDEAPTL